MTLSSCNYFHQEPIVFDRAELPVGSKLCFIGDTGTGGSQQLAVASVLEREGCLEIHLLGDIIYSSGLNSLEDQGFQKKFLTPYKNILKTTPFFLSLGNHDYKGDTSIWYTHAKNNKNIIFPAPFYHQVYGELCITTLDTNAFFIKQLLWLEKIYNTDNKCKLSIFTGHHPLVSSGVHGASSFVLRTFIQKTLQTHTKLYISGHDHQLSDEGEFEGTKLLISGAGGKLRPLKGKGVVWGKSEPGYLVVTIKSVAPYSLTYDFIGVSNNQRSILHSSQVSE
jgi:hypothetical protein